MRLRRPLHGLLTVPLMSAALLTVGILPVWAAEMPAGAVSVAPQAKQRVAVMDFRTIDVFPSLGPASAESLRSALIQLQRITVIERGQIEQIVKEQHFNHTGLVGGDSAVALGKLLGASAIVVGSVTRFGDTYTINARSLDTRTGEALAAAQVSTRFENEIPALLQTVAATLFPATLPVIVPDRVVAAPAALPTATPIRLASPVQAPVFQTAATPPPLAMATPPAAQTPASTGLSKSDAFFKGLLVPSWGQFYAEEPVRAWVTLSGLALGLVMSLYTAGGTSFVGSPGGSSMPVYYSTKPFWQLGLTVAALSWLGGAIDAFVVTPEFRPATSATASTGESHP